MRSGSFRGVYIEYCGTLDSVKIIAKTFAGEALDSNQIDYSFNKTSGCHTKRFRGFATLEFNSKKQTAVRIVSDPWIMTSIFICTNAIMVSLIICKIFYLLNIR